MSDSVTYLAAGSIVAAGREPYSHKRHVGTLTGYGPKIPTDLQVRLADGRARRVYVVNYGNAGSAYVLQGGQRLFIGPEAEQRIDDLTRLGLDSNPYGADEFARQYMETALWISNDESTPDGGEPMDSNYDITDIERDTLARMIVDCAEFQRANAADLQRAYESDVYIEGEQYGPSNAGHDFWLTRCGHGVGFWDRGLGDVGERLSEAARKAGNVDLYIGDIGRFRGKVCG